MTHNAETYTNRQGNTVTVEHMPNGLVSVTVATTDKSVPTRNRRAQARAAARRIGVRGAIDEGGWGQYVGVYTMATTLVYRSAR